MNPSVASALVLLCVAAAAPAPAGHASAAPEATPHPAHVARARGFLERLVSLDTRRPQARERAVLEETAAYLRGLGAYAFVHPADADHGSLVARTHPPTDPRPPVILHATVDARPCPPQGNQGSTLVLQERNGVLLGCGVVDSKAVLAAMVGAFVDALEHAAQGAAPVWLVVTADALPGNALGLQHLLSVLPGLGAGVPVVMQGGAVGPDGAVALQDRALQEVTFQLVSRHPGAAWPAPAARAQALAHLLAALQRVQAHVFPQKPGAPEQAPWQAVAPNVFRTQCRVTGVEVPDPATTAQDRVAATVRCALAEAEVPSQLAWQMVDVVKDPTVSVEWEKPASPPVTPLPAGLAERLTKALGTRAAVMPGVAGPAFNLWVRAGAHPVGVPLLQLDAERWAAAGSADEGVPVDAFAALVLRTHAVVGALRSNP